MTKPLTTEQGAEIVTEYRDKLVPMIELSKRYGVTRQAIHKRLRAAGVDTTKAQRIKVACSHCGKPLERRRAHTRNTKRQFCDQSCYYAWVRAGEAIGQTGEYRQHKQGQRVARSVVSKVYDLKPWQVVHHRDRDNGNNELYNLMVFDSQAGHTSYHRGGDARPVWAAPRAV